jgi:hypothetical protein
MVNAEIAEIAEKNRPARDLSDLCVEPFSVTL